MSKEQDALRQALEALTHLQPTALTSFYTIGDRDKAITAIREALAEQPAQQEPVAWVCYGATVNHHDIDFDQNEIDAIPLGTMLYTSPQPSKPWVGLTQQDIDIAFDDTQEGGGFDEFARAIEAKLKERNA